MAGFGTGGFGAGGGGFGQPQQQQQAPPAFGATPQQQQPAAPGFGSSGFGTPPASAAGGGGFGTGGFGASAAAGGGGFVTANSAANAAFPTFGTPPPAASAGGGFGFGQATPGTGLAFGQSQTSMTTPAAPPAAAAPFAGFAGAATSSASSGFGAGGFGNAAAATTPPHAQQQQQRPSGGGFGAPSSSPSSAVPNPFGAGAAAAAPAPAMSFGTSATVAQPPPVAAAPPAGGFGSGGFGGGGSGTNTSSGGFGGGGFGSATSSAPTAAVGNSPAPAFGASTAAGGFMASSSAFGSGGFGGVNSSPPPVPFGGGSGGSSGAFGTSAIDGTNDMMGANSSGVAAAGNTGSSSSTPFGTIPRKKRPEGSGTSVFGGGGGADDADAVGGSDELSRLKAKLEAKKKKLEEQKRQKAERQHEQEEKSNEAASIPAPSPMFGGGASSFASGPFASSKSSRRGKIPSPAPARRGDGRGFGGGGDGGGGGSSSSGGQIDKAAMAAKNAARFATKTDRSTRSLLPPDLQQKVQATEEGQGQQEPEEGEVIDASDGGGKGALYKAKSLDGICVVMCPDEELLRREKEGDIQMLETPDPGGIHPAGWTLRDTAVKRFRRSAADFKLDIPELVRPSAVLERCCAYLEEWVMERDRQGPDSRYGDSVPPSLDVYQFIWDRTRMIRKDFILQNYTGTGGRCSAAAVRCHERIARWHCMMEHQLSHISEYVIQQSQQNIQELGQAMKTLNQYYDDSEGRSTMEEKDADPKHGCQSDAIMGGQDPVDYDGSVLSNDNSSMGTTSRIIGQSEQASNGTAEPEMRGLYIILTLNNDGGMEVLKYVSSLYKNRPEIYNSRPVQLALSVFRAWKENNYARFFAILRDPDTPYLFACLMFKYVMDMRKSAMKTMSRSFGGKNREGKNAYDKYPLSRFRDLLCYESTDEAREACRHYNIAVVTGEDGGRYDGEWIEWRKTPFKEKTDPKKGHIIPLRPLKMNKTIESKRTNATRLAVCRGEVSGDGSTLSRVVRQPGAMSSQERVAALQEQQRRLAAGAEQRGKDAARLQQQKEAAEREQAERQRKAAEAAARAEELAHKQQEEQRRRQEEEEKERQRQLALQRAEEERKEKLRRELEEKKRREEEARQKEAERIRREKEGAARAEAERKRAEEAARLAAIERKREEERLRLDAEERERQRQLELKRIEEERRAAEARRRAEEEAARAAEAARLAEEERLRKIREEEERREREWQRKLDAARKEMAFRRWRRRAEEKNRGVRQTHQTLERLREVQLDLSQSVSHSISHRSGRKPTSTALVRRTRSTPEPTRPEDLFYRLGNMLWKQIDFATLVADALAGEVSSQQRQEQQQSANTSVQYSQSHVSLFKMAVIVPSFDGPSRNLYETLYKWMYSRFAFGATNSAHRSVNGKPIDIEVRSCVVQIRDTASCLAGCDAAILVIPPHDVHRNVDCVSFLTSQAQALSQCSIRCACLNLDDGTDTSYSQIVHSLVEGGALGPLLIGNIAPASWTVDSLDSSLFACCNAVRAAFVHSQVVDGEPFSIGRISLPNLGRLCLRNVLFDSEYLIVEESMRTTEHGILRLLNETITCLIRELNDTVAQLRGTMLSSWPCRDFASSNKHPLVVAKYWGDESALPLNWLSGPHALESSSPIDAANIEKVLMEHFQVYRTASTIGTVAKHLLAEASFDVKELCKELVWDAKYRQALQEILLWQDASSPPISRRTPAEEIVYLPKCEISGVVERTIRRVSDLYPQRANEENVPAVTAEIAVTFPTSHRVVDAEWKAAIWKPSTESSFMSSSRRSKRRAQRDADEGTNEGYKRRRPTKKGKSKKSQDVDQSKAFSARLEAILRGDATVDMNIGGVALSEILGESTSGIQSPK